MCYYCFGPGEVFCFELANLVTVFDGVFGHFVAIFLGMASTRMRRGSTYLVYIMCVVAASADLIVNWSSVEL